MIRLAELYQTIADWVFLHPVRTDVIVVASVLGGCLYLLKSRRRQRRKLHLLLRGSFMKRIDREKFHQKLLEDGIGDTLMEAVHRGDMTELEERRWLRIFAETLKFDGFVPKRAVKKGIQRRLNSSFYKKKPRIPGGFPTVEEDPTYTVGKTEGLASNKYLNGG